VVLPVSPRRWHPFMLYNELDWLECQLTETYEHMAGYILVEATLDHQGHPKPLYYDEGKARFSQWADKIHHVIVRDLPSAGQTANHWERERPQRDAAIPWLAALAAPDDLIYNLDVDEIPSRAALEAEPDGITGLQLSNHLFAVDWFAEMNVMGTMFPMRCLNVSMIPSDMPGAVVGGLSWIRENRYIFPFIPDAGHHFSWVGGPEEYAAKDRRSPHTEHSADRMREGEPERAWRTGNGQSPVDDLSSYPRYIREHRCPGTWFRPCS
jgi:Glycosyltransferase family 17